MPVTVKIRSGWAEGKENASQVARVAEESGAAALALHPRTREPIHARIAAILWESTSDGEAAHRLRRLGRAEPPVDAPAPELETSQG